MSDSSLPDRPIDTCPRCSAPLVAGMVICPDCEIPLADLSSSATGPLDPRGQLHATLDSGQSLGDRYTIVERVGAGGMGLIYKAFDRRLGRSVALKMIQAGVAERPGARERFKREILLAQQVSHPNVCRVHDLGEFQGQPFISMEYVEGQTLETLVQSMGHLSPSQTVSLAKQICAGLAAIHQRGIVHRDLKPANVMVDRLGHVVLMDFGMAYHEDQERLTQAGAVFGTLGYLSPEQLRGRVEPRSDLYALGLILYEMLAGRRPPGDGDALPLALREKDETCLPPSRFSPEVPEALDQLVMRCLEREPERRFDSAAALAEVLQQFEGQLTRSGVLVRPEPATPPTPRRWAPWLLAGALLLAAGTAYLASRRAPAPAGGPAALAVLPFAAAGGSEAALREALPFLIARQLGQAGHLRLVPYGVSRFSEPTAPPQVRARDLGADLVLEGQLGQAGSDTELRLRLVDARGQERWSTVVRGSSASLFDRTETLAREIVAVAGGSLAPPQGALPAEALRQYSRGMALLEGWDTPESDTAAAQAFTAALELAPEFAEAQAGLARAYLNQFNTRREAALVEQAARAAARAVELAPGLPEAHLALALVQLWRGQTPQATASLQRAEQLAPADDTICRRMAQAYAGVGRSAEATVLFERAVALRPGYWQNHNALGSHLLQGGDVEGAEAAFRKVIELRPDSDTGYANLGGALLVAGRLADAEPVLEAAARIRPTWEVRSNLGYLYYATGRFEEAANQWRLASAAAGHQPQVLANLGDAYRQLGRRQEAQTSYGRAAELAREQLRVNPSDLDLRSSLAGALAGAGDCPAARREVRGLLEGARERPELEQYAAVALAVGGDREQAVEHTLRALRAGVVADVRTNPDLRPLLADARVQSALGAAVPRR